MDEDKQYLLDKTLDRMDHYINTTNNKAAFIIAFNTFILGTIIFRSDQILNLFECNESLILLTKILLGAIFIGVSMSLFEVFKAVAPYDKSGNEKLNSKSALFFGSIEKMNIEKYKTRIDKLTTKELEEDLVTQIHTLSKGLSNKFTCLDKSICWIKFSILIPLGIIFILKIINYF